MITLYGIPNCNTVKKARSFLESSAIPYVFHDFKKQSVNESLIQSWLSQHPWSTLVNRSGMTWRGLDEQTKQSVSDDASAIQLMLEKPSVIKRPILVNSTGEVWVGFDEERYKSIAR